MNFKKTLFFVTPAKAELKDLFVPPGGVLDILCEKKDVHIVLLVHAGKIKSQEEILRPYFSEKNISVEPIDLYIPKGIIEKSFHFFCKYLIFTDTIKILSTTGVRTDTAPSWKHPISSFFKKAIYLLFGWSKTLKNKIVPRLFRRVFRKRPYKELFEKYNPDVVFVTDAKPFFGLLFLDEAKRRNIRTVQAPGNWDHFKYYLPLQSDIMLVPNEPLKDEAIQYENYKPEQVEVTGFPRFDFLTDMRNIQPRETFLKSLGCPENAKLIFTTSEGIYALDEGDIIDMILRSIENGELDENLYVVVRPYPPYPGTMGEDKKFGKFEKHPRVVFYAEDNWMTPEKMKYFANMLYHSDIVINTYSTIAMEALAFDRPVINIGFDGYQNRPMHRSVKRFTYLEHFRHITKTGGVKTVTSQNELLKEINNHLSDPNYNKEKRNHAKERMCSFLDGKASERITKHLLDEL